MKLFLKTAFASGLLAAALTASPAWASKCPALDAAKTEIVMLRVAIEKDLVGHIDGLKAGAAKIRQLPTLDPTDAAQTEATVTRIVTTGGSKADVLAEFDKALARIEAKIASAECK